MLFHLMIIPHKNQFVKLLLIIGSILVILPSYAQNNFCGNEDILWERFTSNLHNYNEDSVDQYINQLKKSGNPSCEILYHQFSAEQAIYGDDQIEAQLHLKQQKKLMDSLKYEEARHYIYYYQLFRFNLAMDRLEDAARAVLKLFSLCEDYHLNNWKATTYEAMAMLQFKLQHYVESIHYSKMAIQTNSINKNYYELAGNFKVLFNAYVVLKAQSVDEPQEKLYEDSCMFSITNGFHYANMSNNNDVKVSLHYKLGSILVRNQLFNEALIHIDSSIMLASPKYGSKELCSAYFHKGTVFLEQDKPQMALLYMDTAIGYAKKIHANSTISKLYMYKCNLYKTLGDDKNALVTYENMVSYKDSVNLFESTQQIAELEGQYNQIKNEKKIGELHQNSKVSKLQIRLLLTLVIIFILLIWVIIVTYRKLASKERNKLLEAEQRLNAIRMNPHFFFNVLTSIQTLTMDDKRIKDAPIYISKFSKIMRASLENSYNNLTTLEEEISFLTQYLDIQMFHLQDKFEYSIRVAPQIEPSEYYIPSMIIQPFIENSIEHGFKNIDRTGHIEIEIQLHNNYLMITINDNGVGFSTDIKHKTYPSRATQIIKDRLYLLNKKYKSKASYTIENLSMPTGTKVTIHLPIINKPI